MAIIYQIPLSSLTAIYDTNAVMLDVAVTIDRHPVCITRVSVIRMSRGI